MEILYLWNGKREGDIGVMGFALVNACGASVSDDFILTPEGRFVGE